MNEFYEEVKQKKSLVSSARHKVSGARSRKCTLPSDHLTAAQKRGLNGPVHTYAINRPMTWAQFKEMPADLQQAHLDYVQNRFSVGLGTIARPVWGVSDSCAYSYAAKQGLSYQNFRGSHNAEGFAGLKSWSGLYGETEAPAEEPEAAEVPAEEELAEEPAEEPAESVLARMLCSGTVLRLSGTPEELTRAIVEALAGRDAELEISFCFKN